MRRCSRSARRSPRAPARGRSRAWVRRSRPGLCLAELGRAQAAHPGHRPSNLRKQWHQELTEKFFLPCRILETKSYNAADQAGAVPPVRSATTIVICSYQFARNKAVDVASTRVGPGRDRRSASPAECLQAVERHRQHAQTGAGRQAQAPAHGHAAAELAAGALRPGQLHRRARLRRPEELPRAVRQSEQEQVFETLKARLKPICHRTLRRQVTAYIPYTKRLPLVEEFTPEESEDRLYDLVSEYLQRDNLQALPASQRSLMTLVLRKLLASSTFAIAGALDIDLQPAQGQAPETGAGRVARRRAGPGLRSARRDRRGMDGRRRPSNRSPTPTARRIEAEIADLDSFRQPRHFHQPQRQGQGPAQGARLSLSPRPRNSAPRRRRSSSPNRATRRSYLLRLLADSPYAEGIVLFNGSNTDDRSQAHLRRLAGHATRAPTASPAPRPPTCAPRSSTTSASRAAS